jgi:integrase
VRCYKYVYSRNGRPRWLHIGEAGREVSLDNARKIALKNSLQVIEGGDPVADRRAQRDQNTFAEVHQRYVEQHARRKNKSWRQGEYLIKRYVLPKLGGLSVDGVTRADVRATVERVEKPVLANQVLANLSAVLSWAAAEDLILANPCKGVTYNPTRSRERVLSDVEVPKFWAALGDSVQGRALRAILLLGQRPGEVCCMRREHIVDGCWWEMPGQPIPALGWPGTKNGEGHRVWLPKAARGLIGDGAMGFVFENGKGGAVSKVDKLMRKVCEDAGIDPPVRPHDLRRTFLSKVTGLKFGRHLMDVIANHKSDEVTDIYDRHDYAAEVQRAMEAVSAHIMDLVEGRQPTNVVAMVR